MTRASGLEAWALAAAARHPRAEAGRSARQAADAGPMDPSFLGTTQSVGRRSASCGWKVDAHAAARFGSAASTGEGGASHPAARH